MAILKCKMCGGDIQATDGAAYGTCESCGTTSTLPKASDEKVVNLFNRANHFRRLNEFDKALSAYESILNEDNTNAEAHWCSVLCRYGIEYVEDPRTHERIPTCHRAQFESVLSDSDYLAALEYADDEYTKSLYENEAKKIGEIQKSILAISSKEEPYDVFICYKETADGGSRTKDSTIAQDIYYELTKDGYKVFFAKITLEDKLGQEYEPYIFSALNSAKVMLVIGTCKEYFGAVWVKNEWSRFLAIMKKDRSRLLIPCYRDMDAYDIPEELSNLQSQDMSKVGFIQDILRGVKKVLDAGKSAEKTSSTAAGAAAPGVESLMKRGNLFLDDSDWGQADEYFNKVLDIDPEYAPAYVGKLCVELNVRQEELLAENEEPLTGHSHYQKAVRFAKADYRVKLDQYNKTILERMEKTKQHLAEARKRVAEYQGHVCADYITVVVKADGTVFAVGDNDEDQCNVTDWRDIAAVAINSYNSEQKKKTVSHTVGLKADGTVVAVGYNGDGQCKVVDWRDITAVSAGNCHTVGLKADGTVVAVGRNDDGRCNVAGWRNIAAISAGSWHTVGLKADGTVVAAGYNGDGQCNVADWREITAIAADARHTVGLKADGTVVAVGKNDDGRCNVADWRDIVAIAASFDHTVGLKSDGTVVAVGNNDGDKCNVVDWRDIAAIVARDYHTVGLKSDGTVVAVGKNDNGRCNVADWRDIAAVTAGFSHTVGLKADGTVVAVGYNGDGRCNVSKEQIQYLAEARKSIAKYQGHIAADYITVIVNVDGTVTALGDNAEGQCNVTDWRDIAAVAVNGYKSDEKNKTVCHTVGLKADGTVVATGDNTNGQCKVAGWRNIAAISAGLCHTVGLKSDGKVVAVGRNDDGRCNVAGWRNIAAISAGSWHTVGLRADGTVVAMGYNGDGQCNVADWRDIAAVAAGVRHTVGLKSDGKVVAVGKNDDGKCNVADWRIIVAVAASDYHTVGLKTDGTVIAAGKNDDGRCNVADWRDIVAVAASSWHTVGLKADGTVVAVGKNDGGRCSVTGWRDIVAVAAGFGHTVGLKSDGTVVAVGYNTDGRCNVSKEQIQQQQQKQWQQQGLCKYCGGKLSGIFSKQCKSCGKTQ